MIYSPNTTALSVQPTSLVTDLDLKGTSACEGVASGTCSVTVRTVPFHNVPSPFPVPFPSLFPVRVLARVPGPFLVPSSSSPPESSVPVPFLSPGPSLVHPRPAKEKVYESQYQIFSSTLRSSHTTNMLQ